MNFIRNRNFRAGPQTSLEGFICPQNSDKQQKIKVFGRSVGGAKVWADNVSYKLFGPKWNATCEGVSANWISIKNAFDKNNDVVQVTKGYSGACANSPISFENIKSVTIHYHTNPKDGVGTISIYGVEQTSSVAKSGTQIGSTFTVEKPSSGGDTSKSKTFSPSTSVSGYVQIYVTCTTNSVYIESVDIEYEPASSVKYDVTWNVNGEVYTKGEPSIKVSEDQKVSTLPTAPEDINGKIFVGWTNSEITAAQNDAPSVLFTDATDAPTVTGNVTYYAVFADSKYTGATAVKIAQTLEYDTWTYSGETVDKTSYRLFAKDSYVESAEFDLSTLAKVVVYGGTFGGAEYNSLTIGDGVKVWKEGVVTGKEATGVNPFEDGTPLSGNGKLRVISNVGTISSKSYSGVRMSKIEIYTNQPVATYYGYCTTVEAAAEPTYTPAKVNFVAHAGDDYYATFSNANVVFMPKNVTISAVTVDNNNVVMRKSTDGVLGTEETVNIKGTDVAGYYIPANTGVLLNSKNSGEVTYYTVKNKEVDAYDADINMLMPAPVAGGKFTAETSKVYYKLAYNDYYNHEDLGFYYGADNGGAFYVKAGTAYLAVPAGENAAKGFTLNGEATGIEGVNANVENAKAIYNLNGQRVASMAKPGLYIVNGKKVVRK